MCSREKETQGCVVFAVPLPFFLPCGSSQSGTSIIYLGRKVFLLGKRVTTLLMGKLKFLFNSMVLLIARSKRICKCLDSAYYNVARWALLSQSIKNSCEQSEFQLFAKFIGSQIFLFISFTINHSIIPNV